TRTCLLSCVSSDSTVFYEQSQKSAKQRASVHAPPPRWVSRCPGAKASTAAAIQRMYSNSSSRGSPGTIWELGTPLTCKTKAPSRNGSASISAVPVEISYVPIVEACAPTLEEEEL